ncbi:cell wall protein [Colletotrichum kahawae]|uniref:Cell wall protein n=1 Tax=Colletotrichum kahawae TaxID=34407 RepID=A0AAE0DCW7_COLKA|nr:cell wall protein [Colletotrichum kahawae]
MKFSAPIALFAAGVLAAPSTSELCTRELSTVNTIMTTVLNGIQNLDTTCLSYTGGPGPELTNASTYMLEIIRTATNNAAAMLPLTIEEAQAFQPLSDELNAAGDKLLTDISSKVTLFSAACICDTTLNWVAQIATNVNTLMTTISTKFPAGGKGGDEIAHFTQVFADMQSQLSECASKPCAGAGGNDKSVPATTRPVAGAPAPTGVTPGAAVPAPGHSNNGTKEASPTAKGTNGDASHTTKGTKEASPTANNVVTAGAAATFSGAGLAVAIAALLL